MCSIDDWCWSYFDVILNRKKVQYINCNPAPSLNKRVVVTTKEDNRGLMPGIYRETVFDGELMTNPSWVAEDNITLSVQDKSNPKFKFRVIKKSEIVSIQEENGNPLDLPEIKSYNRLYNIIGSSGKEYEVLNHNSNWSCNCTGFTFRKTCKLIIEAKKQ